MQILVQFIVLLICYTTMGCQHKRQVITIRSDGYKFYVGKCSGCHRLHYPNEYTAVKWKPILSEMFLKAKLTEDKQKQLISGYLVAKSR